MLGLQLTNLLLLTWWMRVAGMRANQEVLWQLRKQALRHLYQLPRSYHSAADSQWLHFLIVDEINWLEGMNNAITGKLLPGGLSAIVLFAILFGRHPSFAVVLAICAPALFVVNRLLVRHVWFVQERLREAMETFRPRRALCDHGARNDPSPGGRTGGTGSPGSPRGAVTAAIAGALLVRIRAAIAAKRPDHHRDALGSVDGWMGGGTRRHYAGRNHGVLRGRPRCSPRRPGRW